VEDKKNFIERLANTAKKNDCFDQNKYDTYGVKRGLRNKDGTGVLAGITTIGEVHGYVMVEGEKTPVPGHLRYRGYEIEDIVDGCQRCGRYGFEEVCFLIIFGELPTRDQLALFLEMIGEFRFLPKNFMEDIILKHASNDIMNMLARGVLSLYTYDNNPDELSICNISSQLIKLIACTPILAAYSKRAKANIYEGGSLVMHGPTPNLSTSENFLSMIRSDNSYTELEARILDLALMLHAEHGGGNNSTFTAHMVASTGTDVYSVITAAIGSLKGPKHGGANNKVMAMMDDLKENIKQWDNEEEIYRYLEKIMKKQAFDCNGLIYGIGHAIYTLSDPRAVLLKDMASELAQEKGYNDEYKLYTLVEKIAPIVVKDYKTDIKPVCANVDFYSGLVYKMLDITPDLYTPIFTMSRIAGWAAHIIEEQISGGKIIRPAYKTIQTFRKYIEIDNRV